MKKSFATILKELRGAKTMKDFADIIGVSMKTYQNYEYGTRKPPVEFILQIVAACNVSADYLLGLTDDPSPRTTASSSTHISIGNGNQGVNTGNNSTVSVSSAADPATLAELSDRVAALERLVVQALANTKK